MQTIDSIDHALLRTPPQAESTWDPDLSSAHGQNARLADTMGCWPGCRSPARPAPPMTRGEIANWWNLVQFLAGSSPCRRPSPSPNWPASTAKRQAGVRQWMGWSTTSHQQRWPNGEHIFCDIDAEQAGTFRRDQIRAQLRALCSRRCRPWVRSFRPSAGWPGSADRTGRALRPTSRRAIRHMSVGVRTDPRRGPSSDGRPRNLHPALRRHHDQGFSSLLTRVFRPGDPRAHRWIR
jgi:hypothetical protein